MKKLWQGIVKIFGLSHNSKYVKGYLNKANMRSGLFMSAIIFILEVWLIIRQSQKYIFPQLQAGGEFFKTVFTNTSTFWVLMSFGGAMFCYCLQFLGQQKHVKQKMILAIVFAGISLVFCAFLPFEFHYKLLKFTSSINAIKAWLKISFYIVVIAFNITVIFASIYRYKKGEYAKEGITSILVISLFALTCLMFGVQVSYSDFVSGSTFENTGMLQHKQIICFLMMSIYVGCLLIWKPYISLGILGVVFLGFYLLLKGVFDPSAMTGRQVPEGDEVNYLTFFISLTMICISIYDQRVSEAKKDQELELLATRDTLTGLYSFEYFITLMNQKLEEPEVKIDEWVFLFMDITSFKIFNDQRGFEAGNSFLKDVGNILLETFPGGLVSRQSDDHFAVFAPNIDTDEKLKILNEKINRLDLDIRPGVKVGRYVLRDKSEDSHVSIEKARYACAEAKKQLGNYLEYDQKMHDTYRQIQYIVSHIDEAIENGYIKAYYQPVVWSEGRKLCGAEALARWIDPRYGFLSPGSFVPALEKAQLIYKLDLAILRIVCQDYKRNKENGIPVLPVSINFSRLDFFVMDIVSEIDKIVNEYGVDKDYLHVEITESALTDDEVVLKEAIKKLHKLGYAVWLDDFGSGYSSFNVLKDYEFDVLKLDMKFLTGFDTNAKARMLIQSVVRMAEQIGMKTLSEGVETMDEAEFLEAIKCGRLQGYLYGKPLSYEEMLKKIEEKYYTISEELL